MLLGAKAGDVIWYYKTDYGVEINHKDISIQKYNKMLMATVKDTLEILGYYNTGNIESEIVGITKKPKNKSSKKEGYTKIKYRSQLHRMQEEIDSKRGSGNWHRRTRYLT
jgi:hypothetical protein